MRLNRVNVVAEFILVVANTTVFASCILNFEFNV